MEDGTPVDCQGIVTAVFADCFYIESGNRISGIRVESLNPTQAIGARIRVVGEMKTLSSGERYILATAVVPDIGQ